MVPPGSGASLKSSSPTPSRSSISSTPARNSPDLAKVLFPHASSRRTLWAEQRCTELGDGHFHALLTALAAQPRDCPEVELCLSYFRTHRERMRYPEFRAQGLCVGSGVVEAGCKSIVGSRLKRSGMRWSVAGANAMLALRCSTHSGNRFEDFWADRATTGVPPPATACTT